ncbi:hypothetical protein GCM10010510_65780 [Streptomyces anandii JCM 4720]|nr:hypothetical protein [Streptomyces anandii]GGY10689.1 hypothetical protein GCM10010510_65780 [Streptomyces anandii JCM 4720]
MNIDVPGDHNGSVELQVSPDEKVAVFLPGETSVSNPGIALAAGTVDQQDQPCRLSNSHTPRIDCDTFS